MTVTIDGTNGITSPDFEPSSSTVPTNGLFLPTTNTIAWATNSTERLRLDSSGNLGLGVTPSAWATVEPALDINNGPGIAGYLNGMYLTANAYFNSGWKYKASAYATLYEQASGQHRWYNVPSGTAGNAISFTQAMTLDASGNLLVGTTSNISTTKCLISTTNDNNLTLNSTASGSGVYTTLNFANQGTIYSNIYWLSTSSRLNVVNAGGGVYLASGGTSWTSSSDERFKTDLKPIENAAQKVSTLRAVTGRFKTDEEGVSRAFLIAQDVQAVLSEAVDASDPDKLGVQYTDTIPLLVAAIKELTQRLEKLENKNG